ncbi:hypothetical protein [Fortiea contorta]|uniref:hypothetical protein n=1 Tax=Fortiea contorta TaxID=1892405 RepID=UPI00034812D4|nr:hypothetical protein [Fortiea contorta]
MQHKTAPQRLTLRVAPGASTHALPSPRVETPLNLYLMLMQKAIALPVAQSDRQSNTKL